MLKKIFVSALVVLSSFGAVSVSEAHHGDGHYYRDGDCYQKENYCCRGYNYNQNYGDCYYGDGYCCR